MLAFSLPIGGEGVFYALETELNLPHLKVVWQVYSREVKIFHETGTNCILTEDKLSCLIKLKERDTKDF